MPHIKFTGIDKDAALKMSKALIDQLEALLKCPREYFTIELSATTYLQDGAFVSPPAKVDVEWFNRGQEIQDESAKILTRFIQEAGYPSVDIYFTHLSESCYYENGEHF